MQPCQSPAKYTGRLRPFHYDPKWYVINTISWQVLAACYRYVMYGAVCAKVAEEMRKPEVSSFFAKLIQRTSPKSWDQAMGELTVTRKFFENFSGDQVRGL